ncbi:hypothetical protein GCM10028808_46990 [Spirosoma migulaei]
MRYLKVYFLAFIFWSLTQAKAQNTEDSAFVGKGSSSTLNSSSTDIRNSLKVDTLVNAKIKSINADASSLEVVQNGTTWTFSVKTPELKSVLRKYVEDDRVDITYTQNKDAKELKTISVQTQASSASSRIWTLISVAAGFLFLFWLLLRRNLSNLILGLDNRYSNSKFQIVLWFFTLMVAYITTTLFRSWISIDFVGGVNIPSNLLLLSGLSALTFATAKGITENKVEEAKKAGIEDPKPISSTGPKFPLDLFTDDAGNIDMADFQMIIITLLAVITYIVQVFGFLGSIELHKTITLPDVDTTILATFGLGQGAYLAKKFVSKVGS